MLMKIQYIKALLHFHHSLKNEFFNALSFKVIRKADVLNEKSNNNSLIIEHGKKNL
jgi:hypothetical protein